MKNKNLLCMIQGRCRVASGLPKLHLFESSTWQNRVWIWAPLRNLSGLGWTPLASSSNQLGWKGASLSYPEKWIILEIIKVVYAISIGSSLETFFVRFNGIGELPFFEELVALVFRFLGFRLIKVCHSFSFLRLLLKLKINIIFM